MTDKLIAFFYRERLLVVIFTMLVTAGGILALERLNVDAFPDVTPVQVEIDTDAQGLAPQEVEQLITFPVENVMNGIPGVVRVQSESKFGLSVVTVYFSDDTDIYFARQQVFERLSSAKDSIPAGFDPEMGPITTGTGQIYLYQIVGPGKSNQELRTIQDWIIKLQLRTVPGVADVLSFGGDVKQYEVVVDQQALVNYNIPLKTLFDAIQNNNQNTGANFIEHGDEQYVVRGLGLVKDIGDIQNIVLDSRGGSPIRVGDVATVEVGSEIRQGAVTKDGQGEVVTGIVLKRINENTKQVIERIKDKVAEINRSLPEGVRIVDYYDQAELVDNSIHTVVESLIEGEALVLLILLLLLGDFRGSLITAAAIPFCMMVAFILMWYAGVSANLTSLGGLAISIGMMVDATVVMVENIYRHLEEHREHSMREAILVAAQEIGRPMSFAILIVIAVFMPVFALQGIEGKLFKPLAYAVTFSMIGSMIMALCVAPMMCSLLLRLKKGEVRENPIIRFVKGVYVPVLKWTIAHRYLTLVIAAALLAWSVADVFIIGSEFLPTIDEGNMLVRATMPASISLSRAVEISTQIEKTLKGFPEVETVVAKIGRAELGGDPESVSNDEIYVRLKPKSQWTTAKTKDELVDAMRRRVEGFPGVEFNFSQVIQTRNDELISGINAQIAVKIFGEDQETLRQIAEQVREAMSHVRGGKDLAVEQVAGEEHLEIALDRDKLARYGLNIADVLEVAKIAIGGDEATDVLEGQRHFAIFVRLRENYRNQVEKLNDILIAAPVGGRVPLGELATFRLSSGDAVVSREDALRRVVVMCNVTGRDIGSFVHDAQAAVAAQVKTPPGYFITWGGQFENEQQAVRRLLVAIPVSLMLVFVLIYACFNSLRNTLTIIFNIPIALVGSTTFLLVSGFPLSVPAIVGFIAVFGIAVQNGMVMVSYINKLRGAGVELYDAVITGASVRLRAELLSALIGSISLIPFIVSSGTGAEIEKPLAIVVVGGLVTRPIKIVVLPMVYEWVESRAARREARRAARADEVPADETDEAAV
ncbi:MAG TPA: CusA/CzcA family heavy metal efflux RND transporter [Pyrinomonadaceae bacterium]|nr:CusA/CzcA family heavy metal efflux RND transporter [Pyrinomonadaceae bacterium]